MPRFDGTGPQGIGLMTGRGEGYRALVIPESGQAPYGYAGCPGLLGDSGYSPQAWSPLCPLAAASGAPRARPAIYPLVSCVCR